MKHFLFLSALGLISLAPLNAQVLIDDAAVSASAHEVVEDATTEMVGTEENSVEALTADIDPALIRSEDGLVIWPVPADEVLHIYCKSGSAGNLPFEIVSMTGRVVVRGSIVGGAPALIETEGMQPGDHLLRVVDGSGIRQVMFTRN